VETTTYKVKAQFIEMKLEDDHDVHLAISTPGATSQAMIVEFPDTTCNGAAVLRRRQPWRAPGHRSSRPAGSHHRPTSPT
jgi:hypothetical protein